ncbi:hypothetical protein AcW1_009016 [Taiwanofungus camphoratus]|nr:hypothetical protein AcV5_007038 [Antrodia cinnamomea]KAI0949385.1 hypothetical protein AcW1_009016 [Antrodia cinnamomea]KAI0958806.1 hypothetical protein AcV7_004513 [Antrodia cinnamomea]
MVLEIDRIQSRSKRNADLPTWDKSLPYSMQKIYGRAPTISRPSLRSPPMISPQIQGALREVILAFCNSAEPSCSSLLLYIESDADHDDSRSQVVYDRDDFFRSRWIIATADPLIPILHEVQSYTMNVAPGKHWMHHQRFW